jgi:serine/threonine protein kinase
MAALTKKYGELCEVSGLGTESIILVSHKYQYCPPLDTYYALKVLRRAPDESQSDHQNRVTAEFALASTLTHKHVVPTYELLPLGAGNTPDLFVISMEYCAGGDPLPARRYISSQRSRQIVCSNSFCAAWLTSTAKTWRIARWRRRTSS